jgi:zinc/manganese transport system substrate-binding protein
MSALIYRRALLAGSVAALAMASGGVAAQTAPTPAAPVSAAAPMPVVATFSILADLVKQVGGSRVAVTTLVQPGADAHVYSPTPGDARAVAAARLVFVNGLGFEGWVNRLIRSSGAKATIVTATSGIRPLKAKEGGHSHGHSHGGHSHGEQDPHAWQSVPNVKLYVTAIRDALIAADAEGKPTYEANAAAYTVQLDALDAEIRAGIARIPADRRRIITAHDAFQYFERAYGVTFLSPRGVTTGVEPTPQGVARLITQIKREKTPAVFLENITDPRIMQRIAQETGARIGGTLNSDALTPPGGPASTYIDLMRHNLTQLVGALAVS